MKVKITLKYTVPALLSIIIGLLGIGDASGQGKNEEVTIIAPYIPTIGEAAKIPFRPEITPSEEETPTFQYNYLDKQLKTKMELDQISPLKYGSDQPEELFRNYAKVGMGNYTTPYIDFMAGSLQSEKFQFGARLKHHSSQGRIKNYPPSAYSHNLVSVFGRSFSKNHTLYATIGYKRDVYHFYGFSPDSFPDVSYTKDDLKQRFQHFEGLVEYTSNYRQQYKLNHLFRFGFNYFSDYYQTRESQVSFLIKLNKEFKARDFKHGFNLDFGLDYLSYSDTLGSSTPLFVEFRPVYHIGFGQYNFEAGLGVDVASEKTPGSSSAGVNVFPVLKGEVVIVEHKVKAYAEVTGKRTINTFRNLAGTNPFITSVPLVRYTDEQIRIGGGITGNAGGLNFLAEAYYSYLNNMPFFVSDTALVLQNQFNVIYDNINLLKIKANLGYTKIKGLVANLQATYYHYIPKDEEKAWQMPDFELGVDARYTFMEKYTVRFNAMGLGTRYAKTYDGTGKIVPAKMKAAIDLGFGAEYQINRMIAAYIDANNILNQHYQRWYNYPVQGILVMAGIKLSF